MSMIEVVKGEKKGAFRVLVNRIQEGCELHSHVLANNHATQLKAQRYPAAILVLFVEEIRVEKR